MAAFLGAAGGSGAQHEDEEFARWVVQQSYGMLAPMCRIGLAVVALMLLLIDPALYLAGIWGGRTEHGYLILWHGMATVYFLGFLITSGCVADQAARTRRLRAFMTLGAVLFCCFAFLSWSLSGDLSTYAIYLLTMVCVFSYPGRLRMALVLSSTAALVLLICWLDARQVFYSSGAAINLVALAAVALLLDKHLMRLNLALFREKQMVEQERARADRVLYNALPMSIANELKRNNTVKAEQHRRMTVLFVDIVGFTRFSTTRAPDAVVGILNEIFSEFDTLVDRYDVEKIKTIGDAYMVVGKGNVDAVAQLALDMLDAMSAYRARSGHCLAIRAGMHVGSTIAGVIGLKRFLYDVWGDAVNTASRMESTGQAGKIQVSSEVRTALQGRFRLEPRGIIEVKGKGWMATWFLLGPQTAPALQAGLPQSRFAPTDPDLQRARAAA